MNTVYGLLKYVLLLAIVALLVVKCRRYPNIDHGEIDALQQMLAPVKKVLPPGGSAGFYSNVDKSKYLATYYQTQFVLKPAVIGNRQRDTMVVVLQKPYAAGALSGYSVIARSENEKFLVALLKKQN